MLVNEKIKSEKVSSKSVELKFFEIGFFLINSKTHTIVLAWKPYLKISASLRCCRRINDPHVLVL